MAGLRNLAITILCLTGTTNIAAALRHHARPRRPLQNDHDLLTTTLPARSGRRGSGGAQASGAGDRDDQSGVEAVGSEGWCLVAR
jgi:hypothetical protein